MSDAAQPSPYREEELRRALATDPRVNELELTVRIVDARVVVTGVVPTTERRDAIDAVIREAAPDLEPDNRTTLPTAAAPNEERIG